MVAVVVSYNHVQVSSSRDFNPLTWIYSGGALLEPASACAGLRHSRALGTRWSFWDGRRGSDSSAVLNLVSVQLFAAETDAARRLSPIQHTTCPRPPPCSHSDGGRFRDTQRLQEDGPVTVLCELLAKVPQVVVVTAQSDLPAKLASVLPRRRRAGCAVRAGILTAVQHASRPRGASPADDGIWRRRLWQGGGDLARQGVEVLLPGRELLCEAHVAGDLPARGASKSCSQHSVDERATSGPRSHRPSRRERWNMAC